MYDRRYSRGMGTFQFSFKHMGSIATGGFIIRVDMYVQMHEFMSGYRKLTVKSLMYDAH